MLFRSPVLTLKETLTTTLDRLWPVIRAYLVNAGFPLGSVTLKEYGGASSAIAKLWEEPGMRKRAGVETIIKEFPDCRSVRYSPLSAVSR